MKLILLIASILLVHSTSFAGSDRLRCSTLDGQYIISGSLWGNDGSIQKVTKSGSKLTVLEVNYITGTTKIVIDKDDRYTQLAIKEVTAELLDPKNPDTYRTYAVIGAAGKPNYSEKDQENGARELGYQEFSQDVNFYFVTYGWDTDASKNLLKIKTEPHVINCIYSYATTTGGRH